MKIVFSLEKYSVTITEDNWNCNHIPQKGDKIQLCWFAELVGEKNVTEKDDTIQKMNKDSKNPIFCVSDFFRINKKFIVDEIVWCRDVDVYCQINLIV